MTRKLRLVMASVACAGLLFVPASVEADAGKQKPGAGGKQTSPKCRSLDRRVDQGSNAVTAGQAAVAAAKAKVTKRKAAYKNASTKAKKAKAKKRLKKAKKAHKAAKEDLKNAQARLERDNKKLADAGCGG